jgi:heat shock protein HtpX
VGAYGLRTHIWNNLWKSALLLAGFPLLLALMAYGLALVFNDDPRGLGYAMRSAAARWPYFFAMACAGAAVWFAIAWVANQRIIDGITGARPVTRTEEPLLWNTLEALCISRGITMPRLAVIETPQRNAFASGLSRDKGAVTVTRGLLDALTEAELRGVLAHELTHIRNGDARLLVIAAVFSGVISLVAEMLFRGVRFRGGDRRGNGAAVILGFVVIALAWGLGFVLRLALSRRREFLADAGAVELTQDPDGMIAALRRIEGNSAMPAIPAQVRAMFLDDPPAQGWFSGWSATHPPISARVAALVRHAGGQDPGTASDGAAAPWGAAAKPALQGNPWWRGKA